jgi:hypothetical protein
MPFDNDAYIAIGFHLLKELSKIIKSVSEYLVSRPGFE